MLLPYYRSCRGDLSFRVEENAAGLGFLWLSALICAENMSQIGAACFPSALIVFRFVLHSLPLYFFIPNNQLKVACRQILRYMYFGRDEHPHRLLSNCTDCGFKATA